MRLDESDESVPTQALSRIHEDAYVPAGSAAGTHPAWESTLMPPSRPSPPREVDVLVVGAGQAGISAAYELQRRGFVGYSTIDTSEASRTTSTARGHYIVLDAEVRPGGAWQHRWNSLTMSTVNHIANLPGMPVPEPDPWERAAQFVPEYFTEFEDVHDLAIMRPVLVNSVVNDVDGKLRVETSAGTWLTRFLINCTGTWTRPFVPYYPGIEEFRGRQYHTQTFVDADTFWRQRVLVVGGGISALDHIDDLSLVAKKIRWVTRREPVFTEAINEGEGLSLDAGRRVEREVTERVEAGYLPLPVVDVTGLPRTSLVTRLERNGLLNRKPMFDRLDRHGAWWGERYEEFDAIIWATGFRFELRHLAPLKLRSERGGIAMESTHAKADPRVHFIGYGPSASTVGARTYARTAVRDIIERSQPHQSSGRGALSSTLEG